MYLNVVSSHKIAVVMLAIFSVLISKLAKRAYRLAESSYVCVSDRRPMSCDLHALAVLQNGDDAAHYARPHTNHVPMNSCYRSYAQRSRRSYVPD